MLWPWYLIKVGIDMDARTTLNYKGFCTWLYIISPVMCKWIIYLWPISSCFESQFIFQKHLTIDDVKVETSLNPDKFLVTLQMYLLFLYWVVCHFLIPGYFPVFLACISCSLVVSHSLTYQTWTCLASEPI